MKGIKVYVTTKAAPFQPEQFIDVHASRKEAEKKLKEQFPFMRRSGSERDVFSSDKNATYILFIHEKEI